MQNLEFPQYFHYRCQNHFQGEVNHLSTCLRLNQKRWKHFRWHPGISQIQGGFNHLSTFDLELRNVSFELISFMGFPAILSALQPFQICICKRNYSILTFSNGSQLMRKRFMPHLTCIIGEYMQKWNFQDFHQMSEPGREGQSSFNHVQAKSELKTFRWHPGQSDWGGHLNISFNFWSWRVLRNVSFALISFMEFSAILSALQPFQICI